MKAKFEVEFDEYRGVLYMHKFDDDDEDGGFTSVRIGNVNLLGNRQIDVVITDDDVAMSVTKIP